MCTLCVAFSHADVLSSGVWTTLRELENPELRGLAERLPTSTLNSKAESTTRKYLGAFRRWKTWASSHSLDVLPAAEQHVALYLQQVAETSSSRAATEEAVYALAWAHDLAGIASPTTGILVQTTLQGLRRLLAKPVLKKEPITIEMLRAMVDDVTKNETLANVRLTAACLLAFSGFLRFNELVNIRCCDVSIGVEMLKIRIPKSKTDQLRKGDEVVIARSSASTCPVRMLEHYIHMAKIDKMDTELFLFRPITKSKMGECLRAGGSLGYSTMRELFKKKMRDLGYSAENFGIHSLRAGGTTAAANAGVPDRLFKRHGRWRSENAKDGYIEDTLEKRLSVSRQIGL